MNLGESAFSTVTFSDTPVPIPITGAIAVDIFTLPAVACELVIDAAINVQVLTQPQS